MCDERRPGDDTRAGRPGAGPEASGAVPAGRDAQRIGVALDIAGCIALVATVAVLVSASEARPGGGCGGGGRAGWGRRGAARLVDDVVAAALWAPLGGLAVLVTTMAPWSSDQDATRRTSLLLAAAGTAVAVGYEVVAGRAGAGLGKRVCGLRVEDREWGSRLPFGRALARGALVAGPHPVAVAGAGVALWGHRSDAAPLVAAVGAALAWRGLLAAGVHDRLVASAVARR